MHLEKRNPWEINNLSRKNGDTGCLKKNAARCAYGMAQEETKMIPCLDEIKLENTREMDSIIRRLYTKFIGYN